MQIFIRMLFFTLTGLIFGDPNDLSGVGTSSPHLNISKVPGMNYPVAFVFASGNSGFVNDAGAQNVCPGACQHPNIHGSSYEWYRPNLQDYQSKYNLCPIENEQPFVYAGQPVSCNPGVISNGWGYDATRKLSFCMCLPKLASGALRGLQKFNHVAGGTKLRKHVVTSMDSFFSNEQGASNICEAACQQEYGEAYTWDNNLFVLIPYTLSFNGITVNMQDGWGINLQHRISFCRCIKKKSVSPFQAFPTSSFDLYPNFQFRQKNPSIATLTNINSDESARLLCPQICAKVNGLWDNNSDNENIKVLGVEGANASRLTGIKWGEDGMTRCDVLGMKKILGGKGWGRSSFCNCYKRENNSTIFQRVYANIHDNNTARTVCPAICNSRGLIVNKTCAPVCDKDKPISTELGAEECRTWFGGGLWDSNDKNDNYAIVNRSLVVPYEVMFNRNLSSYATAGWGARIFCNCYYPGVIQLSIEDEFDLTDGQSPKEYCDSQCKERGKKLALSHKIIHPTAPIGTEGYYLARNGSSSSSLIICACAE